MLGRGGISRLSALTGLSRTTITKAVEELESGGKLVSVGEGRVRQVGGGRKKIEEVDPGVRDLLTKILEETTAGDPMSQLRWTSKSTRTLAEELTRLGHPVSWVTVARCLDDMGYSLQANRKSKEGPQHADRDATDHGVSLPSGNQQVEQDRAPAILVYQSELERRAADQLRDDHQSDRRHQNAHRAQSQGSAGHERV